MWNRTPRMFRRGKWLRSITREPWYVCILSNSVLLWKPARYRSCNLKALGCERTPFFFFWRFSFFFGPVLHSCRGKCNMIWNWTELATLRPPSDLFLRSQTCSFFIRKGWIVVLFSRRRMTLEDWMKETSALIAMGCKGLGPGLKTEKFETTVSVNVVWSEKKKKNWSRSPLLWL